jgi:hypothetical protein
MKDNPYFQETYTDVFVSKGLQLQLSFKRIRKIKL